MKSILDPNFRYTASYNTDLKKTFARIRGERRRAERARMTAPADANVQVLPVEQHKRRASV